MQILSAIKIPCNTSFAPGTKSAAAAGRLILPQLRCNAVKSVAVISPVSTSSPAPSPSHIVCRITLHQGELSKAVAVPPVRIHLSASGTTEAVLDSCFKIDPALPVYFAVERMTGDSADDFDGDIELLELSFTPLTVPNIPVIVHDSPAYNSWPMIQSTGGRLVCMYSRGDAHTVEDVNRGVYAKYSDDHGKTWSAETTISNRPGFGEVTIGKGLDHNGNILLWVRSFTSSPHHHDLYRSSDGINWELIAAPQLDPVPMQITDIFPVPGVGLMALWFAGNYRKNTPHSWGTVISRDQGISWQQQTVEKDLSVGDLPTEPSAIYLGNGKIFAIARTEAPAGSTEAAQFQLYSDDYGKHWSKSRTNITDVCISTPSLIFDPETGIVSNYYYHRGRGVMKCRTADIQTVLADPFAWPPAEALATGGNAVSDAGNVNATAIGKKHFLAYYSTPEESEVKPFGEEHYTRVLIIARNS